MIYRRLMTTVAVLAGLGLTATAQTVEMPVAPNTEPETGPVSNDSGFVLSLDGAPVDADPQVEDRVRRVDLALERADVIVQTNALDPVRRLDVEVAGPPRAYAAGETVELISETNYPAFLARGEMRIIDRGARGGPRLLTTRPVAPNGRVSLTLPEGRDLVAVYRVYDARGRYDETAALSLGVPDDRAQSDGVEEGTDNVARKGIPVNGAAVTVSASNVARGAVLETMGTRVRPDAGGRVVIERILPPGDYDIDVAVRGPGQTVGLVRPVTVPGAEWFYSVLADVTLGYSKDGETDESDTRTTGRVQAFVDGETADGVNVTASIDTGEEDLDDILRRLDEKNPRDILERIDANDGYPTYGDDSSLVDATPTSGKLYLRVEKEGSFFLWGDYQSRLSGNSFVRNERMLYGAQAHYEAQTTTERGDPTVALDLYAAQPDQLIGRDVFRGTGGSVYFLRQQDISPGTQTVTIELRDAVTGRVVDRQVLSEGRDYRINALQGIVTLTRPLSGSVDRRLINTTPGGDETVSLVVQYEYTPTTGDVDGFAFGGRGETWLTDDLRLGLSGLVDDTGVDETRVLGADLRYEIGENSFVQLDVAESDGPGFDTSLSDDGGLVFDTDAADGAEGRAIRLEAHADFGDLGLGRAGYVAGYFERRDEGFASLDYSVGAGTGDETLYGFSARVEPVEGGLGFGAYADVYENDAGTDRTELGVTVDGRISPRLAFEAGLERVDRDGAGDSGDRLDAAVKLSYDVSADLTAYVFGQGTLSRDGLESNDRVGVGATGRVSDLWSVEAEVSDGRGGLGARILATRTDDANNSTYFGYELDPGRSLAEGVAPEGDGGRYVTGGRRQINDRVAVFGENTYDLFDRKRELISAYGLTYTPDDFLSFTTTVDIGRLNDPVDGDIDRTALTFGVAYDDAALRARGRVEWRQDDYEDAAREDTDAVFLVADAEYRFDEEARLLFSADMGRTEASGLSFEEGRYVDTSIGYAFRPIDTERLNVLARYRYFYDTVGQEVDGVPGEGPVQESHIFSVEGNYDLNERWTLGAKVGGRLTRSAPTAEDAYVDNDAVLLVANARHHVLHKWDLLLEARHLELIDAGSSETGVLGAAYRHVGNNAKLGVGYNFGQFSSDLGDLTFDDHGAFVNVIVKF